MEHEIKRKKSKHPQHTSSGSEGDFSTLLKNSAIGAGLALVLAAALLFLGAALCYATEDPNRPVTAVGLAALYLSALAGGWIAVVRNRSDALLCGLICGGLMTVFFWFLTVFLPSSDTERLSFGLSLVLRGLTVLASVLGAFLGARKKATPKHRRRPRKR